MQKRIKDRVQLKSSLPSATKQSFKDKCDVNKIISRYNATGLIDHVSRYQGRYADVSGITDYASAFQMVKDAEKSFLELPAALREHFRNSPAAFFDFVTNPENIPMMAELGLIPKLPPEAGSIPAPEEQEKTSEEVAK